MRALLSLSGRTAAVLQLDKWLNLLCADQTSTISHQVLGVICRQPSGATLLEAGSGAASSSLTVTPHVSAHSYA